MFEQMSPNERLQQFYQDLKRASTTPEQFLDEHFPETQTINREDVILLLFRYSEARLHAFQEIYVKFEILCLAQSIEERMDKVTTGRST